VTQTLRNWAGNVSYWASSLSSPTTLPELQELVATSSRIKAIGTRHSFSTIADTPGTLVSTAGLPAEIVIDERAMTVRVNGATSYGVLARELQSQGYALQNMGSLPHISVAGATATGTHGSGDRNGILSTSIAAIDLVTADGEWTTIDRSAADLAAVAVGLGAFGVIVGLTLDIQPTFTVRQDIYLNVPWSTALEQFDDIMSSAYSVSLMGHYAGPTVEQLWCKVRLGEEAPAAVPESLYGGSWYDDADLPEGHNLNIRGSIPGPWSERLSHFRLDSTPSAGGDELQSEWFVDRADATAALTELLALGNRIDPHLHATEIRTCAADELWLSPAYQRHSVCLGFTWRNHPVEVAALLPVIEQALAPFEPRAHWGKLFAIGGAELVARYPRAAEFRDLVGRYDPTGKFWNPFLSAVFAEGDG
jgi:xylitol oxidase